MPTYVTAYREEQPVLPNWPRKEPQTVKEFLALVKKFDQNVTRRDEVHKKCQNCCNTRVQKTSVTNKNGYEVDVRELTPGSHEALELSEEVMESLCLTLERATPLEISATEQLQQMIQDSTPESILQRLGRPDPRDVRVTEMESLLELMCHAFFPSPGQLKFRFMWAEREPGLLGSCGTTDDVANIEMNPLSCQEPPAFGALSGRAIDRLGTLLHELVHAFIQLYACQQCSGHYGNVKSAAGHGIVWQRIANWVEHAASHTLKIPIELGRFETIQDHWNEIKALPSPEEAKMWELKDA
jgi:hypothetical protein